VGNSEAQPARSNVRSVWDPFVSVRPILSLRSGFRALIRRGAVPKQPIIFDFRNGRAYRASEPARSKGVADALFDAVRRLRKTRVHTAVEGLPPDVVNRLKT
jgi:hypothetical protein